MFNIYLQEKAMALKIGRQKKIQIIDGQQVEVLTGDDEDDEVKKMIYYFQKLGPRTQRALGPF